MCIGGPEVTTVDPKLRATRKQAEQSHGIHKVEWKCLDVNSGNDSGYEGLETSGWKSPMESIAWTHVSGLLHSTRKHWRGCLTARTSVAT